MALNLNRAHRAKVPLLIPVFRRLPPPMHVYSTAVRTHHKNLYGIIGDGVNIPMPLTIKIRPLILVQHHIPVSWRPISFKAVDIDGQLDTFILLKQT